MRDRREIVRTGIGILAPTILVLESQAERLREVESVERAVQGRWGPDAKRRRAHWGWRINLEQRHERRHGVPLAAQGDRRLSVTLDDPFRRAEAVTIRTSCGLDFYSVAARPHRPDHRPAGVRFDHGDDARVAPLHAHQVERRPVVLVR